MPASFIVEDSTVTICFEWPGVDLALAQEICGNAALYDWRRGLGPIIEVDGDEQQKPWEDLTNQEKLDMVYAAAQRLIIAQARTALVNTDVDAARADALAYADENYQL